ncbi:MAG: BON domain-containing protein [Pseudomonadota bacterium]
MADNRNEGWRGQRGWGENSGSRGHYGDQRQENGSYDDGRFGREPAVDYNDSRSMGGYGRQPDRYASDGRSYRDDDRDYLTSGLRAGGQSDRPEDYGRYGQGGSRAYGDRYRSGGPRAYGDAPYPYGSRDEERAGAHEGRRDRGYGYGARPGEDRSFNAGHNQYLEAVTDGDDSPGEHKGRGPKGYRRSDDRIREDINDRLTDDGRLDATHVDVQVIEGEVTLTGTVDSREAKRRAEDIAERVTGVGDVQNNLRINRGGGINDQTAASTAI